MSSLQELAEETARKVAAVKFDGREWDRTRKTRIILEYMKKAVAESEDRYDGAVRSIIKLERGLREAKSAKSDDTERLDWAIENWGNISFDEDPDGEAWFALGRGQTSAHGYSTWREAVDAARAKEAGDE